MAAKRLSGPLLGSPEAGVAVVTIAQVHLSASTALPPLEPRAHVTLCSSVHYVWTAPVALLIAELRLSTTIGSSGHRGVESASVVSLQGKQVLIAEDASLVALYLAFAVEDAGGKAIGPASTVSEAINLLDYPPDAAILDVYLADRDSTPLALELCARNVPFVFHTSSALPAALKSRFPGVPLLRKPVAASIVLNRLLAYLHRRLVADG